MIRFAGLLGAFLILVQLLLISWGRLTKIHKINGQIAFLLILFHAVSMLYIYGLSILKIGEFFRAFLALMLFIVIVFTSVFLRKTMKYEIWYYIHLLTYIAVLLAFGHQNTSFPILWNSLYVFTFANVFYFKFLKLFLNFWKYKFKVEKIVQETESTVSLYITGIDVEKFLFEPGQYVVIRFLTKDLIWQAHPFSFSAMPGKNNLRLTIKNSGDFTSQLATCHLPLGTPVILDGPYGEFTAEKSKSNKILLIAGGVGVTPLRVLVEQFVNQKKDVVMVYATRNKNEILFQKEMLKYNVKYIVG
ncbi:MAG: ferric reductase-like transmembrane domain-containing protein, partial [Patescibacteria group bacterium]